MIKNWMYTLSPKTVNKVVRYGVYALFLIASLVFTGVASADLMGGGIGGK